MLRILTFLTLLFAIPLALSAPASAQGRERQSDAVLKRLAKNHSFSRLQVTQVADELERQQVVLRHIAARFEAVADRDFTPLLRYPYVWSALRENRMRVVDPNHRLSAAQSKLLEEGYGLLEEEVILSFLDHQLAVFNDALELNEVQMDEVQKALTVDLSQKRMLLSSKDLSAAAFVRKLDSVSDATEKSVLAVLFPEQRKIFNHQLFFNRDRLVG
jgi:hypothetical protein